jgi:hypothetical protein
MQYLASLDTNFNSTAVGAAVVSIVWNPKIAE